MTPPARDERRWTLDGGIRKTPRAAIADFRDTLVAGPPLELRESVEVMPVAAHEADLAALRDAAQAVVGEYVVWATSTGKRDQLGGLIGTCERLRAVLASADSESREETP